jgi:hypothetical protein
VRTSVQHLVGGLDPNFQHTCDMEIWMRLATRSSVAAVDATQAYYRRHDANMSTAYMKNPLSDLREQLGTATKVLTGWGAELPGAGEWMTAMKARLVEQACWMAGLAFERGDMAAAKMCIDFAAQNSTALWRSPSWLRYQAKRLAGRKLVQAMRKRGVAKQTAEYSPFEHGVAFGWWPQEAHGGKLGG